MSVGGRTVASYFDGEGLRFEDVYKANFAALYIHAYRMLGDKNQAKDVVQDVFTTVWQKRDEIIINKSIKAYLYNAVKNKILNIYSHQALVRKFETTFDQGSVSKPVD